MKRQLHLTYLRFGIAALAVLMSLAIVTGGGSAAYSASAEQTNLATVVQTMGSAAQNGGGNTLPGMEKSPTNSGLYNTSGGDNPGQAEAPDAGCPILPCFSDVPAGDPFYTFTNKIYMQDLVSGYPCGGPGEPCNSEHRPYYRPGATVSRAQMSKFIDNARHLEGIDIASGNVPISVVTNANNGAGVVGFGSYADSAGLAGYGTGTGIGRTIGDLNSGVFSYGRGSSNSVGMVAVSDNDNGAWIGSMAASGNNYGLYVMQQQGGFSVGTSGDDPLNDSYIGGDLEVAGNCTGCTLVVIMQNTGTTDLHQGEIAAMTSAPSGPAEIGNTPLVGAGRAEGAYSTAVAGVVYDRYITADPSAREGTRERTGYYDHAATAIKPGEYFGVVTSGAYKNVKVSAANGPIHVGDLLVASDTAGVAMKADPKETVFGSVIGKAMANLESGDGTMAVMITLK